MKNIEKYSCDICDFKCSVKRLYNQHLRSIIHKIAIGEEDPSKYIEVQCDICDVVFNSRSSLWRHKKICVKQPEQTQQIELDIEEKRAEGLKESLNNDVLIKEVLKQTKILQEAYLEQSKTIELLRQENERQNKLIEQSLPLIANGGNNTTNNITNVMNNNFNINVFLNEKCKDALNLSDFIQSLTIEIEDLDKTKNLGFAKGISDIIVKNLRQLDVYRRPIHCSDPISETMYIKNDNIWAQDKEDKPMVRGAITAVARKQVEKVKDWEEEKNVWQSNENGANEYIQLVKHVTNSEENENSKIIKNIAREVIINKSSQ